MRSCHYILLVLSLLAGSAAGQTPPLNSVLSMAEFVHDWEISKQFTLEVANSMPAEFYSFKPNPEEMTFGEQIIHIAGANVFRFQQITGVEPPFVFDPAKPPPSDKQTATRLLEQSFDYVIRVLPQITPAQLQRTWHIPSWEDRTEPDGRAMILNMFGTPHTIAHSAKSICE